MEAAKLSALATTGAERSALMPSIPTTTEAGIPGVKTVNWYGLHVQAATPPAIQERLKAAVHAVQIDPEFKTILTKNATSTGTVGADEFEKMIRDERERLTPVIRALGALN